MSQDQRIYAALRPLLPRAPAQVVGIFKRSGRILVTVKGCREGFALLAIVLTLAYKIVLGDEQVIVDLEKLDVIDLDDIGLLIRARSVLRQRGQRIVVRSPCSNAAVLAACALLDPLSRVERVEEDKRSDRPRELVVLATSEVGIPPRRSVPVQLSERRFK